VFFYVLKVFIANTMTIYMEMDITTNFSSHSIIEVFKSLKER